MNSDKAKKDDQKNVKKKEHILQGYLFRPLLPGESREYGDGTVQFVKRKFKITKSEGVVEGFTPVSVLEFYEKMIKRIFSFLVSDSEMDLLVEAIRKLKRSKISEVSPPKLDQSVDGIISNCKNPDLAALAASVIAKMRGGIDRWKEVKALIGKDNNEHNLKILENEVSTLIYLGQDFLELYLLLHHKAAKTGHLHENRGKRESGKVIDITSKEREEMQDFHDNLQMNHGYSHTAASREVAYEYDRNPDYIRKILINRKPRKKRK